MELFQTYAKEIVALLVPFITWLLNAPQRYRPKLMHGTRHAFTFLVQQPLVDAQGRHVSPTQTVNTASVMVQNNGRQTATKVQVVFNWKPMCINIWPSRHIEEKVDGDSRYAIIIDSLAPAEFVGFELLAVNAELPALLTVRCDQCVSSEVQMAAQPVAPAWKVRLVLTLMFFGMAAAVYVVLAGLQWLILKTPI